MGRFSAEIRLSASLPNPPPDHHEMKPPAPHYRRNLSSLQSSLKRRWLISLAIGLLIMTGAMIPLAHVIIPHLRESGTVIHVTSSPTLQESEQPPPVVPHPLPRPTPQPPVPRSLSSPPPPMPAEPLLARQSSVAVPQLLAQSEETLLRLDLLKEEELERLRAQEQQETTRKKEEEEARQLAALSAARKAAEQEVRAAKETEVRQKVAQKKAVPPPPNRIVSTPTIARRISPDYPTSARRGKEQGTTQIAVTVTSSGKVSAPRITRSSGHSALDYSALAAVRQWRFNPAKNSFGQPIAFRMTIPITFRLK